MQRYVEEDDIENLNAPVTLGEVEAVLKWFKKDNSPSSDGCPIEFYLTFFEVIGRDLLQVIEESWTIGRIYDGFNATFIALIPKTNKPLTFNDSRPISLCKCI